MLNGRIANVVQRIEKIFLYFSGFILLAMMFLGAADVLGRYFFNRPIRGTLELSSVMMGAIVFLCWGLIQRNNGHVKVELLVAHYPDRQRTIVDFCTHLMSLVLFAMCTWQSIQIAITAYQESRVLPTLGIPTAAFYALVPIGAAFLCLELVFQMISMLVSIRKG